VRPPEKSATQKCVVFRIGPPRAVACAREEETDGAIWEGGALARIRPRLQPDSAASDRDMRRRSRDLVGGGGGGWTRADGVRHRAGDGAAAGRPAGVGGGGVGRSDCVRHGNQPRSRRADGPVHPPRRRGAPAGNRPPNPRCRADPCDALRRVRAGTRGKSGSTRGTARQDSCDGSHETSGRRRGIGPPRPLLRVATEASIRGRSDRVPRRWRRGDRPR